MIIVFKYVIMGLLFLVPFVAVYAVGVVGEQPKFKPEACQQKASTYLKDVQSSYNLQSYMDKRTVEKIQSNVYGLCMQER